ncbi:hypothetical protein ACWFOP_28575, partial [Bacillus mycoides]
LDTLLGKIDSLISRPFHPAPQERADDAGATESTDKKGAGAESIDTSAAADDTPKPRRRTASRGWFGSRVDED